MNRVNSKLVLIGAALLTAGIGIATWTILFKTTECQSIHGPCFQDTGAICDEIEDTCKDETVSLQPSGRISDPHIFAAYRTDSSSKKVIRGRILKNESNFRDGYRCFRLVWRGDIDRTDITEECSSHSDYELLRQAVESARFTTTPDGKHAIMKWSF